MTTKPQKQHFVSQCYLKEFGIGSKKHRKVRVVKLATGNSSNELVKDVAQLDSFNTLHIKGKSSNELESIVAGIESSAAPALDQLRSSGKLVHAGIDASICFMSMFAVRSPFVRAELDGVLTAVGTGEFQARLATMEIDTTSDPNITEDMIREHINAKGYKLKPSKKLLIACELMLLIKLTSQLTARKWSLIDARGCKNQFITSDRPVVLFKPSVSHEAFVDGQAGFATPESIVHFPVSPKLALHGTFEGYEYEPEAIDDELVASYNTKTIERSGSQIFHQAKTPTVMSYERSLQEIPEFIRQSIEDAE